jgi:hypothetical protein
MLAAVVLQLSGCGGGASSRSTVAGSCNNAASGFCVEYTGSDYRAMKMQKVCEAQKSEFLAGACPTEGRVGSCLVHKGKNSESYYRYYTGFQGGVAAAESQCTRLKGQWITN